MRLMGSIKARPEATSTTCKVPIFLPTHLHGIGQLWAIARRREVHDGARLAGGERGLRVEHHGVLARYCSVVAPNQFELVFARVAPQVKQPPAFGSGETVFVKLRELRNSL